MKFFDEFKEFVARGNVMDMAVGVVIGGAFKAIVDSLVADIINPLLAFIGSLGSKAAQTAGAGGAVDAVANMSDWVIPGTGIGIGNFISAVINFLIMAFIIFCFVKAVNNLREKMEAKKAVEEANEPDAPTQEELLAEIRDLLKDKAE